MQVITYEELKDMTARRDDVAVINVLAPEYFQKAHIPASVNVPLDHPDFSQRVEQLIGGKDRPVVLYCASMSCNASKKAAQKLEEAGFTNIKCYEGGMQEWQEKSGSRQAA